MTAKDEVFKDALELPPKERLKLMVKLLESLEGSQGQRKGEKKLKPPRGGTPSARRR